VGLFGKKKGLVGVDIGSSAVKAVELKVGGKGGDERGRDTAGEVGSENGQ
jgi:Tfp pilus assembly PilM family ATPase